MNIAKRESVEKRIKSARSHQLNDRMIGCTLLSLTGIYVVVAVGDFVNKDPSSGSNYGTLGAIGLAAAAYALSCGRSQGETAAVLEGVLAQADIVEPSQAVTAPEATTASLEA